MQPVGRGLLQGVDPLCDQLEGAMPLLLPRRQQNIGAAFGVIAGLATVPPKEHIGAGPKFSVADHVGDYNSCTVSRQEPTADRPLSPALPPQPPGRYTKIMCNLYRMRSSVDELRGAFGRFAGETTNLPAYDAIYPDREAPVLRQVGDTLTLERMTWGVPPPAKVSRPVTNVRNLSSPFWRSMLQTPERRCLVPVTSFCEWTGETGSKSKVWFGMADDAPFCFAGIWRPTDDGDRTAFLTCAPNELVGAIHPKAMPVILRPDDRERWLIGTIEEATALAQPLPDELMRIVEDERPSTLL